MSVTRLDILVMVTMLEDIFEGGEVAPIAGVGSRMTGARISFNHFGYF